MIQIPDLEGIEKYAKNFYKNTRWFKDKELACAKLTLMILEFNEFCLELNNQTGVCSEILEQATYTRVALEQAKSRVPEGFEMPKIEVVRVNGYTVFEILEWRHQVQSSLEDCERLKQQLNDLQKTLQKTKNG